MYGQATYTPPLFNDIVHLTGGLRWSDDVKDGQLYIINNAVPVNSHSGVAGILGFNKSWSRVDPMVNLAVDVTPNAEVYAKWGTGYRSGGANSRSLSYLAFGPEEITMSEIGAKSEFFEHRLRFNIAAYIGDYKDIQIDFTAPYYSFDANGNIITSASTTRTTTDTINAPGTGHVHGVEIEFTVAPLTGVTLSISYAYNYVHIPPTINPFPTFVAGVGTVVTTVPTTIYQEFTPNDSLSGQLDYQRPFQYFVLKAHFDGNWDDGSYGTDRDSSPTLPAIKSQPGLVFNGRLSVADIGISSGGPADAGSLWARNLTNEQHLFIRTNSLTSGISGTYNDPRTFGFEGRASF